MKIIVSVFILLALTSAVTYPTYKQCDSSWGSETLGGGPDTVCKAGCLMSSVAMALAGNGKSVNGSTATPKTLNSWLKNHSGYSGELFVWGSASSLGLKYVNKVSDQSTIKSYIAPGRVAILNVNKGGHWVLATGVSGSTYTVNDPGYSKTSYAESEVTQAGLFTVSSGFLEAEFEAPENFEQ